MSNLSADLNRAAQLYAQNHSRGAAELCRAVIQATAQDQPEHLEANHLLALTLKRQGQLTEAETLLRICSERAPERPDIQANYGNLLTTLGNYSAAENQYRIALKLDPNFRAARLALARLMNSLGRFPETGAEVQLLLQNNPQDAEALVTLGIALREQGKLEEAEQAYRYALEAKPDYATARHNLGALLAYQSRSEEALTELEKASDLGLHGPELDFNRASALISLNRFEAAQKMLRQCAISYPDAVQPLELLSRLNFMRGHKNFAAEFAQAAERYPADAAVQLGYAKVLHGAGEFAVAEEALQRALTHGGPQPMLLAELASIQQEQGQFTQALHTAQQACNAAADDARLQDLAIDALMSLGRADEALPLIQSACTREPWNQGYIALEATAARLLGDESYNYLCDYENLVQMYELEAPPGWSSMAAFNSDLAEVLIQRHQFDAHPLDQSLRHGTQTPRGLLNDPDPIIQAFLKALHLPIERYRQRMGQDPAHPLKRRNVGEARLRGCWSVRLQRGGYHVNHVHPQGWISSAYYVQVPPEVADERIRNGWIKFGEPRFPVPGAPPERFVHPQVGRLVLFPSYMWHGTTPIHGDKPRMTIAFDVVSSGRER